MKKIITFIIILLPWFLSSLVGYNNYFNIIYTPSFTPPKIFFPIIWTILYILIAISIFIVRKETNKKYLIILSVNYIFNQLYTVIFFKLNNLFLSFLDCFIIMVTSFILLFETKKINKVSAYFLIPYTLFSIFATILSFTIYIMNI